MKLGPVTKLYKRNKNSVKIMSENCDIILTQFFKFMDNLEHSGSRIPDTKSVKLMFSLTVTFYLTKTEIKLKHL